MSRQVKMSEALNGDGFRDNGDTRTNGLWGNPDQWLCTTSDWFWVRPLHLAM